MTRGRNAHEGDTMISQNGYHYTRTATKWRLTHHLVAEKKLGRPIAPDEQVYFVDKNRKNFDPANIEVRIKYTRPTKREGQLWARIVPLVDEYIELKGEEGRAEILDHLQQVVPV
jgi:hypothetical protein